VTASGTMRVIRSARLTHIWSAVVSVSFLVCFLGGSEASVIRADLRLSFPGKPVRKAIEVTKAKYASGAMYDGDEPLCSSLDGPSCPIAALVDSPDEDYDSSEGVDVMARVKKLSEEADRLQARRARVALQGNRKNAVTLERERLARANLRARARTDEMNDAGIEPTSEVRPSEPSGLPGRPKRTGVSPGAYLAAMTAATSDVACSVCEALTREALAFAERTTPSGRAMSEQNVLEHVHELCRGDIPPLLHSYAIVPVVRSAPDAGGGDWRTPRRFALCERDGKSALTSFEQKAFQRACARVRDEVDVDLAEGAFTAAKRTHARDLSADRFESLGRLERSTCGSVCGVSEETAGAVDAGFSDSGRPEPAESLLARSGLDGSGCAYSAKGYWAWEVCFSRTVRQYHAAFPETDRVVSLGFFKAQGVGGSALPATDLPPGYEGARFRYVDQFFVGGEPCDEARGDAARNRPTGGGRARRSIVRWACSPDGAERVAAREPRACEYVVTVFSPALCRHPGFKVKTDS